MAKKSSFTFASADGRTTIHGTEWMPEQGEVRGILQIVHGMLEFMDCYEAFAEYLAGKGFIVTGHDQLGHGASVVSKEEWGFFEEKDGNAVLLKDIEQVKLLTEEKYPGVPHYILGHSMGSFLVRQFICIHGEKLDGAVIMGTGCQPLLLTKAGKLLCKMLASMHGWHHTSRLIDKIAFGTYNKRFEPVKTRVEWLTKDEAVQIKYISDERCRFKFTVNGYYNLFHSMEQAWLTENLKKMPRDLPVFIVSGKDDPVGAYGKDVETLRKRFKHVGMTDVTWMLYENDRHEILNETDKDAVYNDLHAWLFVRAQDPRRK